MEKMINLILKLRDKTGINVSEIKEALELCHYNEKMTMEYLEIKYSGVNYHDKDIMDIISKKANL